MAKITDQITSNSYKQQWYTMGLEELRDHMSQLADRMSFEGKNGLACQKWLEMSFDEFNKKYDTFVSVYKDKIEADKAFYYKTGATDKDGAVKVPVAWGDKVLLYTVINMRLQERHLIKYKEYIYTRQQNRPEIKFEMKKKNCLMCPKELPSYLQYYCSGKCMEEAKKKGVYDNEKQHV